MWKLSNLKHEINFLSQSGEIRFLVSLEEKNREIDLPYLSSYQSSRENLKHCVISKTIKFLTKIREINFDQ